MRPKQRRHFLLRRIATGSLFAALIFMVVFVEPATAAPQGLQTDNIEKLSSWLMYMAIATCVGGIFVSCILWALGSKGQNPGQELTGKRGIVLCLTAALFIGLLVPMINYFEQLAQKEDKVGVILNPNGAQNSGANCTAYQRANNLDGCTK